ncbi:hypothetical protein ND010_08575 [Neisseria gonorrhoeae]|nr:hypothetical protein [Neisseria gonorrhoeae]UYA64873.1 hypothetical protein ND010_08575 [Neisseria gonorrhoeae]
MRGTRRIRGEKRFARRVDGCPVCRKLEAADEMAAYAETLRREAMRDALEKRIGRSGIARGSETAGLKTTPSAIRSRDGEGEGARRVCGKLRRCVADGAEHDFFGQEGHGQKPPCLRHRPRSHRHKKSALVITVGDMLRTVKTVSAAAARRGRSGFS